MSNNTSSSNVDGTGTAALASKIISLPEEEKITLFAEVFDRTDSTNILKYISSWMDSLDDDKMKLKIGKEVVKNAIKGEEEKPTLIYLKLLIENIVAIYYRKHRENNLTKGLVDHLQNSFDEVKNHYKGETKIPNISRASNSELTSLGITDLVVRLSQELVFCDRTWVNLATCSWKENFDRDHYLDKNVFLASGNYAMHSLTAGYGEDEDMCLEFWSAEPFIAKNVMEGVMPSLLQPIVINDEEKACSKLMIESPSSEGTSSIPLGKDCFAGLNINNHNLIVEIAKTELSSEQLLGLAKMAPCILTFDRCQICSNDFIGAFTKPGINAKKVMFKSNAPSIDALADIMRSGGLSALSLKDVRRLPKESIETLKEVARQTGIPVAITDYGGIFVDSFFVFRQSIEKLKKFAKENGIQVAITDHGGILVDSVDSFFVPRQSIEKLKKFALETGIQVAITDYENEPGGIFVDTFFAPQDMADLQPAGILKFEDTQVKVFDIGETCLRFESKNNHVVFVALKKKTQRNDDRHGEYDFCRNCYRECDQGRRQACLQHRFRRAG